MSGNELDTTEEEWRSAMSDLTADDPGLTVMELCERYHTGRSATQRMLNELVKDGKCKKGRATREGSNGAYRASVYQIVTSKQEKKK